MSTSSGENCILHMWLQISLALLLLPPPLDLWALHSKSFLQKFWDPVPGKASSGAHWGTGSKRQQTGCFRASGLGKRLGVWEAGEGHVPASPASCQSGGGGPQRPVSLALQWQVLFRWFYVPVTLMSHSTDRQCRLSRQGHATSPALEGTAEITHGLSIPSFT